MERIESNQTRYGSCLPGADLKNISKIDKDVLGGTFVYTPIRQFLKLNKLQLYRSHKCGKIRIHMNNTSTILLQMSDISFKSLYTNGLFFWFDIINLG